MKCSVTPADAAARLERRPEGSVLACGASLKNRACLLGPQGLQWSALHGDLSEPQACHELEASARHLAAQARPGLQAVAHDLHPDFFSTRLAVRLAHEWGLPAIGVQHHHAHIAAVMAEHGLEGPVLGLALDGVGLGSDGGAWGGELLWVSPGEWRRLGALSPIALPGGDRAAREPWRLAAAALHALGRLDEVPARFAPTAGEAPARGVQALLQKGLNCPPTSSTGRWFDAAAGALGLSVRQSDEAEAAIRLQSCAEAWLAQHGPQRLPTSPALPVSLSGLDLRPLLAEMLDTPQPDAPRAAAHFHRQLARGLSDWATLAAEATGTRAVCLGGGCFFNRLLTELLTEGLRQRGLSVYRALNHSSGDAGLALGQAWVAARQIRAGAPSTQPETALESLPCALPCQPS